MAIDSRQGIRSGHQRCPRGSLKSLLLALSALAYGPTLACGPTPETVELEVYSWWQENSERDAFAQVKRIHERDHDDVTVTNVADPRSVDIRKQMARRLLAGGPPATFQANIGADLLQWTVVDTEGGVQPPQRLIHGLSPLFERTGLSATLPMEILQALKLNGAGEPFGVPINVHRLNMLYFHKPTIEASGKAIGALETLCPTDRSQPLGLRMAFGTNDAWTLVTLAFENVLVAQTSPDFYEALFRGEAPPSQGGGDWTDDVRNALSCVQYLSKSFGQGQEWEQAVTDVKTGNAAFTVMGDWANGMLVQELQAGTVEAIPFPGSENTFVFTSDTFPLPLRAANQADVEALLETMAGEEAQRSFSEVKGSFPARTGVVVGGPLAESAAAAQQAFSAARKVVATSGLFPPYYPQENLGSKLQAMVAAGAQPEAIEPVIDEFRYAAQLLQEWQERQTRGAGEPP